MIKHALVTGSTSGIGKAFADQLARERHNLILVSRDREKLADQQKMLAQRHGVTVHVIAADLAEPGAAANVYAEATERGLEVEILVNNAGFNESGPFMETRMAHETSMIQLHAICATEMMKLFLPAMVQNGYGRVVNLGSTASYMACPNDAVYAATKAYILRMSKAVHGELKGTGVTVTALCPGSTRTAFASKAGMEGTSLFKYFVMKPEAVAAAGCRGMDKGRAWIIPGIYNKLLVLASKITPAAILNPLIRRMLAKT